MCDRSHLGNKAGRFDKTLVETYRGPANAQTSPVTAETTGTAKTMTGSKQAKGFGPQPDRT